MSCCYRELCTSMCKHPPFTNDAYPSSMCNIYLPHRLGLTSVLSGCVVMLLVHVTTAVSDVVGIEGTGGRGRGRGTVVVPSSCGVAVGSGDQLEVRGGRGVGVGGSHGSGKGGVVLTGRHWHF